MEDDTPQPILNHAQRRLLSFTITLGCLILLIAMVVFIVRVMGGVVSAFSNLLGPLAVAGVLAMILRPVVAFLQTRLRLPPAAAVAVLYLALAGVAAALATFLVPILVKQIVDFATTIPSIAQDLFDYVYENFPRWAEVLQDKVGEIDLREQLEGTMKTFGEWAYSAMPGLLAVGGHVLAVFSLAAGIAIIPVYLFFFLQSQREPTENLEELLPFLRQETRGDVVFLVREFIQIVVAFFRGQLLISLIVGVLLAIGFSLVGLRFGIVLGLALGLLNVIPYLGFITGLILTIPLALVQSDGGPFLAGLVLAVFLVVQSLESWMITPKIMGDRTGLHPVVIILAIFFWGTALGGILGMILAIPLTAFFVTAFRLAKKKYFIELA